MYSDLQISGSVNLLRAPWTALGQQYMINTTQVRRHVISGLYLALVCLTLHFFSAAYRHLVPVQLICFDVRPWTPIALTSNVFSLSSGSKMLKYIRLYCPFHTKLTSNAAAIFFTWFVTYRKEVALYWSFAYTAFLAFRDSNEMQACQMNGFQISGLFKR